MDKVKAFNAFKSKQQKVYEVMFFVYKSTCSESLFIAPYTIHWDKIQILKTFLQTKESMVQKMSSFFFRELKLIPVLLLIRNSHKS